ncbi:MAG: hypothetical protein K8R18_04205 [Parvibaculum sp.]|uniref:hypothetical protein n=1 Tax=Parvibaculum sp. TaxID=2024848 RepID=UPI0025DE51B2|nr:hypothetical protein [Parvibaculum sp.]MCE9648810.1 hypothetical protein [Parvibaculum sp.]
MEKKDTATKAKPKKKPLPQKERFIQAARAAEVDENGERFNRDLAKIIKAKPKPKQ